MSKKSSKKQRATSTRWHDGTTSIEELGAPEQIAHRIVSQWRDLAPSVERIVNAQITDDQRIWALTAFEASIGALDDPNRDPRVAIANAVEIEQ